MCTLWKLPQPLEYTYFPFGFLSISVKLLGFFSVYRRRFPPDFKESPLQQRTTATDPSAAIAVNSTISISHRHRPAVEDSVSPAPKKQQKKNLIVSHLFANLCVLLCA